MLDTDIAEEQSGDRVAGERQGDVFGGQASSVRLLWEAPGKGARGPKPALSGERIAAAAMDLADAEGLAAVSMQRVAALFGFTKMSLYRYFPGKAELMAYMIDIAIGAAPDLAAVQGGWRPRLGAWARAFWTRYERHPWLLEATAGRRVPGPNELAWVEAAAAALNETGLNGSAKLDAVFLVSGHIRNVAEQTLPTVTAAGARARGDERQLKADIGELLQAHRDRFPTLAAVLTSAEGENDAFDFGLGRIFDGLQAHTATKARKKARNTDPARPPTPPKNVDEDGVPGPRY